MRRMVILAAVLIAGCATIMHGTKQEVGVSSSPTNAKVTVDNMPLGNTPVIANLKRGENHLVKIELEAYAPYETTLTTKVSGWVWGNIVFGGLIGLAVDAISGGLYALTPEQISATLSKQTATTKGGVLEVFVVLKPDAGWKKIGQLTRE